MNKINILFLGGAKRVSLAEHLIAYGKDNGIEIGIFSYELDVKVPIGRVGKVLIGLKWKDEKLYEDLVQKIKENHVNIVLPFVDPAILVASRLKTMVENVFIPVSDEFICNVMFDKVQSTEWFAEHNIIQPVSYKSLKEIQYPAIFKPRTGSASKGIFVARSSKDVEEVKSENYLVQQYIENCVEYTVDCYVSQKGEVTSVVPRIRLETAGGEVTRTITKRNQAIIAEADKILTSGIFRGPITIQFITNKNEENIYVMEINPRFGGGVIDSIEAGSDSISMLFSEYYGKRIQRNDNWKENTLMIRYYKEVIYYADNN